MNASELAEEAQDGGLVFLDPLSGVHYGRFYHVLESVARGGVSDVTGAGRCLLRTVRRMKSAYSAGRIDGVVCQANHPSSTTPPATWRARRFSSCSICATEFSIWAMWKTALSGNLPRLESASTIRPGR